ncbi:MAG TPA: hypothetical protein VJ855_06400 [Marinilabiliaceae bacterium]|nr:hypothetical protein [Marinilabiliaceae bacterium]
MPYRRLPNTDQARLRALKSALERSEATSPSSLAFSQKLLLDLKQFYPHFHQMLSQYQSSRERQASIGRELNECFRSARLYVSHFLQVVNLSIIRGEFKPSVRRYYGLPESERSVPEIGTEQQLLQWGEAVINGEQNRMATGATRIYNPSLALVRIRYEKFVEQYNLHKDLLATSQKLMDRVIDYRLQADRLITEIWNEIEASHEELSPEEKREECASYGIVYVFRPSEKICEN